MSSSNRTVGMSQSRSIAFLALLFGTGILFPGITVAQNVHPEPNSGEREWRVGEEMRRQSITLQEEGGISPDEALQNWRAAQSQTKGEHTLNTTLHYNWEFLGPANQSGCVTELLSIPGSNQLVAGAAGGGIWTYGADSTWRVKTDSFPGLNMTSCASEPQNPLIMAMGTSQGFVYFTSDGGASWRVGLKSPGANVKSLTFHPSNVGVLYAATDGGLAISTDLGNSWKTIAPGRARSVFINPQFPLVMYYGQMDYGWPNSRENIMRSVDGGKTFTKIFTQPEGYWSDVLFGMCRANPSVLWLGTDSARVYFRSQDGGTSWQQCAGRPYADSYYNGFWCFFADPHDANTAIAGGPGLFRTTDGGANWVRIDSLVHADFHACTFPGGTRAAIGCDGGVYVTDNYLANSVRWRYQSTGLKTLEAYNVAGSPDGSDVIITGNQDNGYAKYTHDPLNWRIVGGDGFVTIYNPNDPTIFYHEYTEMNLHRANDGFTWWSTKVMTGLPTTTDFYTGIVNEPVDWYGQGIAIDPNNPSVLYCGTDSLFVTTDNGDSWNLQSQTLMTRGSYVSAIAVSPVDSNTIYVGSADGLVSFTHDHGMTWDTVAQSQFSKQAGRIYSIACDPTSKNGAYLSMQLGANGIPLYRTTDGGFHWVAIVQGLPPTTTSKILIDPKSPNTLYVATSSGVCVSNNSGASWQRLTGLPDVQVVDLSWQFLSPGAEQCLLVGSYGRGIIRGRLGAIYSNDTAIVFLKTRVGKSRDTTVRIFLTNTGSVPMSVAGLRLSGSDSTAFKILSGGGAFTLPANSSYSLSLRFQPTVAKNYSATVLIAFSDGTLQNICQLTGIGTIPKLQVSNVLDFGAVLNGGSRDSLIALAATNFADGPDTLLISTPTIIGPDAVQFTLPNFTNPVSVMAGNSTSLRVRCQPTSVNALTANLVFQTNGIPSSDTMALRANAIADVANAPVASAGILLEASPNPATTFSNIKIHVDDFYVGKRYTLSLVDAAGNTLRVLSNGERLATTTIVELQAADLPSGTYLVVLETQNKRVTTKLAMRH